MDDSELVPGFIKEKCVRFKFDGEKYLDAKMRYGNTTETTKKLKQLYLEWKKEYYDSDKVDDISMKAFNKILRQLTFTVAKRGFGHICKENEFTLL